MKYNYVVLGSSSDLYDFSYSDLRKTDYAFYVPGIDTNLSMFGKVLFRLHTWRKLNDWVKLPFKHLWNRFIINNLPFGKETPLCFIFFSNWVEYENQLHLVKYLKETYTGCRVVWFLQDIVASRKMREGGTMPMGELKQKFDLICSFDQKDCEEYGLVYHHLVFSSFEQDLTEMPYSDVYFLGKAKNRQHDIIKIYEKLKRIGLKCDFHIAGVPFEERVYTDDIDYDPQMSYMQNLQHILHTKCLLEVMQKDGTGFTQRGCEAVCLDRKLLTNNPQIHQTPFYNLQFIHQFSDIEDIDMNFLKSIPKDDNVNYKYKSNFSPICFLKFIEEYIK